MGKIKATILAILSAAVLTVCIIGGYVFYNMYTYVKGDLVIDLDEYKENQNQTSFIYTFDKNGKKVELARLHGDEDRVWVDLKDISPYMRQAFVSIEDTRFETHRGVDWKRVGGIILKPSNLGQGGSTITQQLIKNITNQKDVTLVRKVKEILTALNLEEHYNKDTVIEAYLNTLYLGNGCYGVKTASEKYFGKNVKDLNAAECACLASITKFPTKYNPLLNPDNNKVRQEYTLLQMKNNGYLTEAEYEEAVNYKLIFTNSDEYVPSEADEEIQINAEMETKINSYYVDAVIDSVIENLMDENGYTKQQATNKIYYGGLKIYAAVDLDVQAELEDVYENRTNFPSIRKDDGTKPQSSMTIMDYSGRVVAIVGGAGEKTTNRGLNRATKSWRQPGSTIKPISTYAPAIELGYINYSSKIKDYAIYVEGELWPHNVDKTLGSNSNVTVQKAVAQSLNTVPARIIKDDLTIDTSYEFVKNKFHLSRMCDDDRGLAPLATGALTYGTNTLEMTAAYASFGNGGYYYKPFFYYLVSTYPKDEEITTFEQFKEFQNNELLSKYIQLNNTKNEGEQIISAETADIMNHLLQTVPTSYYGTGTYVRKFPIMAKTGTTSSDCDRWFCAGTPYYVASVWLGYDIKEALHQDVNPCGKIWITVMNRIHKGLDKKEFPTCDNTVEKRYCMVSGKLAGPGCYSTAMGTYNATDLPETCYYCKGAPATRNPLDVASSVAGDVSQVVDAFIGTTSAPATNATPPATTQ